MSRTPRINPVALPLALVATVAALALSLAVSPVRAQPQDSSRAPAQSSPRAQAQNPSNPAGAFPRIHLRPQLLPGAVFRYQIQFQTSSQTSRSGTVTDPQGPSQTVVTWNAVLRVEVLPGSGQPAANSSSPATAAIRLRATYEKSSATLQSDTPDPEQQSVEAQYARMEGKSMEFTLGPDGRVSDVQGLEGIVSGPDAVKAAQQWMEQFSSGASEPAAGVVPGDNWTSQDPASTLPLAGRVWRSDSSYLRNEACPTADPAASSPAANPEMCAVILTQLNLITLRAQKDPTPEQYRAEGLQTSGTWNGSGQSLNYISLQTGWVVTVTQSMSEQMDVTISPESHGGMRYAGAVNTHSSMSLLPATENAP